MRAFDTNLLIIVACIALLTACESNTSPVDRAEHSESDKPATEYSLPYRSGIWRGMDSNGHQMLLLAAREASMTRIADLTLGYVGGGFEIGHAYSEEDGLDGYGYWALPPIAEMESYGWSLCILDAHWAPRLPVDGKLGCSQMPDGDWVRDIYLEFDPLYDLEADLNLLAGHWTDARDPGRDVASFNALGELTGQSGADGCVYLGNASVVDGEYNLYRIDWSFDNCRGESAALNSVTLAGLAIIDNSELPVTLTYIGTGRTKVPPYEENGRGISFTAVYQQY